MANIQDTKSARLDFFRQVDTNDRREQDRRKEPSDGYTYVTVVGWIDRREKIRRSCDPFNFFD